MATTKAVVFYDATDSVTNSAPDQSINEAYVNLGTESQSTRVVQSGSQSTVVNTTTLGPLTFDAAVQKYFFVDQMAFSSENPVIYVGNTTTGAVTVTPIYTALTTAQTNAGDSATINDIIDSPATNRLYFTQEILDRNENVVSSGIYSIAETGGTATQIVGGLSNANFLALDLADNLVFFSDSTGTGLEAQYGGANVNKLDVANLSTGAATTLLTEPVSLDQSGGPYNGTYDGPVLSGVAVNPLTHTLYYTTNDIYYDANNAEGDDGIYSVNYAVSGSGTSASASINTGAIHTLYAGTNALDPSNILLDVPDNAFYVVAGPQEYESTNQEYGPYDLGVYGGSLSASNGAALTRVTPVSETAGTQPSNPSPSDGTNQDRFLDGIAVDVVPQEAGGATVRWIGGNGPVVTDAAFTDSSGTSPSFTSATVKITGGESGDVLAATVAGTPITASYNASSFTLTLTGNATPGQYQQVIDSVTYNNTSANPTASGASDSRTLTYAISDGIVAGTTTSTVTLEVAAVVTPGNTTTFTGGGAPVAADAVTLTDYTSATLAGATVSVTGGFLSGDTLGFNGQNGITGSYNGSTGVLTLSGTSSVAQYQAALRSVTFGFSPTNGNPTAGGDTSRTLSVIVSDGTVSSAAATSTLNVVHAPPTVSAGSTVTFTRGDGSPVATDPAGALTAPDSGGTIASATVSITAGFASGDVLASNAANGITSAYNATTGVLSLSGTATAAQYQAAIDGVTFSTSNTATIGNRTLSYVANDGTANSTVATSTVTVAVPTPAITGAAADQAVSDEATISPFAAIGVTDTAGETDSATITLSNAGTATDGDGTLSSPGAILTTTGTGTYTLAAATPATLASELQALVFTPTAHQVAAGSTVTTAFNLTVADTGGGAATNTATSVVATAVADAPTIAGTVGNQLTTDQAAVQPFSGVTIGEVDNGAMPTVTIVLRNATVATDADGALSGMGLSKTGTGTYQLAAATPAVLTNEIDTLTFTPTRNQVAVGNQVTTNFAITAAFAGMSVTDANTMVAATDVPCFCAGTLIRTERGEVAVEQLAIGDRVVTVSGALRPIVWIGTRRYAGRFLRANPAVQPVCLHAGSLGEGVPTRDLHISPLHALWIDGLLIPAGVLVNGTTITRERVDTVAYFHIELASHDVLLAEGAPAESFLDDGSRGMFHNADEFAATWPNAPAPAGYYARRVEQGFELEAIRARLARVSQGLAA